MRSASFLSRNLSAFLAAISLTIAISCFPTSIAAQTGAAEPTPAAQQPLIHAPTGFHFPAQVGPFQREPDMRRYDTDGRNISVGYNTSPHRPELIAMTVYVYPAPPPAEGGDANASLDEEFRRIEKEIIAKDRFAHMLYEQTVTVDQALPSPAKRAVFAISPGWGPAFSEALLFRAGDWFVLYRASYRQECAQACSDKTKQFVLALKWPQSLRPPSSSH